MVEFSRSGIAILQHGRVDYLNPQMAGMASTMLVHNRPVAYDQIHPEDVEEVGRLFQSLEVGGMESGEVEFRLLPSDFPAHQGQQQWLYCGANIVNYRGQPAILANMVDLTRAKEMEHLLTMENKMTSLGRVAAGIVHELRNPLSGINMYTAHLERIYRQMDNLDPATREKVERIFQQLKAGSQRMENVMRKVVDFARPNVAHMTPTDINDVVGGTLELSEAMQRKNGVEVRRHLGADLPRCYTDPGLMEQVLSNLITNALKSMEGSSPPRILEVSSSAVDNAIVVTVADSGPGVPAALQQKIFDPFFSTHREGWGLGLSFCRRVIDDHGGSLRVGVSPWGGAEFRLEIPIEPRPSNL